MKLEELYKKIVRELEKHADAELASKKVATAKYFGVDCKSYGIKRSEIAGLIEKSLENFKKLSLEERFELAKKFYASDFSEQVHFGDVILKLNLEETTPFHYNFLDEIGDYLNNWADTDWFCSEIAKPLLIKYPKETLTLLRKWNSSENLWKRRASVVTFTRKIGESGEFTDVALELCDNLIWDKEDYVRKGVGWALKDNMRGAKKRVLDYVKSLRRKGVSSVITLYAIRDLKGKEREEVLRIKPKKD
ncbi:MAG: DNA alkylation repair protein [Candidatus Bathyarchaeota archaeon]|nr:DNA alkylation repair protein [Candidatus Bathyarchaeota archaeon]